MAAYIWMYDKYHVFDLDWSSIWVFFGAAVGYDIWYVDQHFKDYYNTNKYITKSS